GGGSAAADAQAARRGRSAGAVRALPGRVAAVRPGLVGRGGAGRGLARAGRGPHLGPAGAGRAGRDRAASLARPAGRTPRVMPKERGMPPLAFRVVVWFLCVAGVVAGCSKPTAPQPDGSSGVRGKCLLPAGDAGKDAERQRWAGVVVTAYQINSPYTDFDH